MDSLTMIFTLLAVAAAMVFKSILFGGSTSPAPVVEPTAPKAKKSKKSKAAAPASAPASDPAPAPAPAENREDNDKKKKKKKKGKPDLADKLAKEEEEAQKAADAKKAAKAKKKKSSKPAAPVVEAERDADEGGWDSSAPQQQNDEDDGWDAVPTAAELKRKAAQKKAKRAAPTPKGGEAAADGSVTVDLGGAVAAIIGKGGETIKKLQADTKAKLDIQKSDDGSSSVKISGDSPAAVKAAVEAVKAILAKSPGFQSAATGTAKATVNAGAKMAAVIGRGGATIKFIGAQSGARIDTSRDEGDSTVTISGTPEQVAAAKALVLQAISGVDITAEATQTVEIGAQGVPLVIGTGGTTIKMLQSSTGARIDIARGSTTCTVSGDADAVSAAVSAIRKLILDNSHAQTIDLDCHVGVIIGKGGATIRSIQESSGAKVDIESRGDGCLVSFSGSEDQIAAAKAAVMRVVEAESAGPELADGEVSETIELPESCVGSVIGKQGASIRALQDETGAKVDISRGTGTCIVYGQPEGVTQAVAAIQAIVDKQAQFDEDKAARDAAAAAMAVEVVEESGEDSVWAAPSGDSGW